MTICFVIENSQKIKEDRLSGKRGQTTLYSSEGLLARTQGPNKICIREVRNKKLQNRRGKRSRGSGVDTARAREKFQPIRVYTTLHLSNEQQNIH